MPLTSAVFISSAVERYIFLEADFIHSVLLYKLEIINKMCYETKVDI